MLYTLKTAGKPFKAQLLRVPPGPPAAPAGGRDHLGDSGTTPERCQVRSAPGGAGHREGRAAGPWPRSAVGPGRAAQCRNLWASLRSAGGRAVLRRCGAPVAMEALGLGALTPEQAAAPVNTVEVSGEGASGRACLGLPRSEAGLRRAGLEGVACRRTRGVPPTRAAPLGVCLWRGGGCLVRAAPGQPLMDPGSAS